MDFELTEEERAVQTAARDFALGEFTKELALDLELREEFPVGLLKKACELGFIGGWVDEKYGGQGLAVLENVLITEEFCRKDSGIGISLSLADFASEIILRYGSEEQKQRYLTKLTKGEAISAGAFTEPEHGSDITSMSCVAVKDGDEYVINGTKTFITNGTIADFILVLCQTDTEAKPTYRGQSVFIVEKGAKGLDATKIERKMGIRMSPIAELSFSDVRLPKENLVGKENRGFYQVMQFFDESRVEVAAQAVGIAQGAFDRALSYAAKRQQFGQRLIDFQVTQHKFADMATRIEAARLLTYKSACSVDRKKSDPKLSSMAKAFAGRVAVEVADEAIQILGGYGYITDNEVERFYRDAKVTEIYEGTREIQKNTIARELMGKLK